MVQFHDEPRDPAHVPSDCMAQWLKGPLVEPHWLAGVAPHAKIHGKTSETLDGIRAGDRDLQGGIEELTGRSQAGTLTQTVGSGLLVLANRCLDEYHCLCLGRTQPLKCTSTESVACETGGLQPRRINLTGWCTGGQLSQVAALWAAVHYPEADVRCITFGAQKAGNAAFAEAFRSVS